MRNTAPKAGCTSRMVTEIDSLVSNPLGGSNHFGRLGSPADGLADCP
jgi:hypothetical protein